MAIHVFGSCEKKLKYIGKVNAPSGVCVYGRGAVFPSCQLFSFVFFRQKAAVVFQSLKARVFLYGDEGEGTEAFFGK